MKSGAAPRWVWFVRGGDGGSKSFWGETSSVLPKKRRPRAGCKSQRVSGLQEVFGVKKAQTRPGDDVVPVSNNPKVTVQVPSGFGAKTNSIPWRRRWNFAAEGTVLGPGGFGVKTPQIRRGFSRKATSRAASQVGGDFGAKAARFRQGDDGIWGGRDVEAPARVPRGAGFGGKAAEFGSNDATLRQGRQQHGDGAVSGPLGAQGPRRGAYRALNL